jgi:uncharacterized protein
MTAGQDPPADMVARLGTGGGGPQICAALGAGQYGKHALLLLGLVRAAERRDHPDAGLGRACYDLLAAIEQDAPDAVRSVVRHPAVGAWATGTWRSLTGPAGDGSGAPDLRWLAAVAGAAAVRSGGAHTVDVPVLDGTVLLPSLGSALVGSAGRPTFAPGGLPAAGPAPATAELRCAGGAGRLRHGGRQVQVPAEPAAASPGWRPLPRLRATAAGHTLDLAIDDSDPYRMPAATNLARPLRPAEVAWWRSATGAAWNLLALRHPPVAQEIAVTLRVLTPLAAPPAGQVSASSPDTYGTVAMSVPADATTFALTLAHEVQHAKLTALLDIVPLTRPGGGRLFYAPWRDDPRPARALLHGSYAHLAVAGFWRQQRRYERGDAAHRAHVQYARWRAGTHTAVRQLLASGQLTAAGEEFAAGMERTLRRWAEDAVPERARMAARRIAEEHLRRWRARNGSNLDLHPNQPA